MIYGKCMLKLEAGVASNGKVIMNGRLFQGFNPAFSGNEIYACIHTRTSKGHKMEARSRIHMKGEENVHIILFPKS
jgi:hypothetical protein